MTPESLDEQINRRVGEVRTDTFDMSFGEIVSLHQNGELVIQPEYQRLFRWTDHQKSVLIESILLELPVPQIFTIENHDGVLELIDGLQRLSSVLQFIEPQALGYEPLVLSGCALVPLLNGMTFESLPLSLKLRLKRSPIRTIVIKRQSQSFLRYEMFKRLNTGGSNLEPQEIRNCSARMFGQPGIRFYSFLTDLSADPHFRACAEYLPQPEVDKKADEELVLRFLALKSAEDAFRGSVRDWLDEFMESVLLGRRPFDYDAERTTFRRVFRIAHEKLGEVAFLRFREDRPLGSLAPAYFEAITMGILATADRIESREPAELRAAVTRAIQTDAFRDVTGPGANSKAKLRARIDLVTQALAEA